MSLPKYVQIDGHDNLVRDTFSMGVINTNSHGLEIAKKRQRDALKRVAEDQRHKAELNTLRNEVTELKSLLQQLLPQRIT